MLIDHLYIIYMRKNGRIHASALELDEKLRNPTPIHFNRFHLFNAVVVAHPVKKIRKTTPYELP